MLDTVQSWVTLAKLVRPQGRRGELLADLHTDFPDLFTSSQNLVLLRGDGERIPTVVENYWMPTGKSAGRVVVKLAGADSITAAEALVHCQVQLPAGERLALDNETYYVSDLVGCEMCDRETLLGAVSDIHFPVAADGHRIMDSASLFVVVRPDGQEVLIPFVNAFVTSIDTAGKRISMSLPAGLLDLND